METKNYLEMLRSNKKAPIYVSMGQALCYYLYENGVPHKIIMDAMHRTKSNVFYSIQQAKNRIEVNDKIMEQAYGEIAHHKIRVVPCTVDGGVLSRHVGYKLLIDNVIF
jgi:hypothetical protein